jgi:hypothetical protein
MALPNGLAYYGEHKKFTVQVTTHYCQTLKQCYLPLLTLEKVGSGDYFNLRQYFYIRE